MGLATIDPHSHNVHTKFYKISKFGENRPNSKQDTAIWSGWPYTDALLIKTFDIFQLLYLAYYLVRSLSFYPKLGVFVKLGMHFMTTF